MVCRCWGSAPRSAQTSRTLSPAPTAENNILLFGLLSSQLVLRKVQTVSQDREETIFDVNIKRECREWSGGIGRLISKGRGGINNWKYVTTSHVTRQNTLHFTSYEHITYHTYDIMQIRPIWPAGLIWYQPLSYIVLISKKVSTIVFIFVILLFWVIFVLLSPL